MASASTDWFNAGSNPSVQTKCETELVRSGTTITVYWTVRMKLPSSGSYLGTGVLNVTCSCGGSSSSGTIKSFNDRWSGTTEHTCSGSFTFQNSSTSTETFTVGFSSSGDFSSSGIFSTSVQCSVNGYDAYAEINSFNVQSIGLDSAVISYSVSRSANIYCSVDGSAWGSPRVQNTTSGTFTITGLSPNTQHSFKILSRATSSGLDRVSSTKYETTKDIGRISSVSDFNHGNNANLVLTNPSGSTLDLAMKIDNTDILNKIVQTGNNEINFTDEELDSIYRLYGSSNQLTATFILTTAGNYTDTKTATITLTGNQKTGHKKINNEWKRSKRWLKVNGEWKRCVRWSNVNGNWKRCI